MKKIAPLLCLILLVSLSSTAQNQKDAKEKTVVQVSEYAWEKFAKPFDWMPCEAANQLNYPPEGERVLVYVKLKEPKNGEPTHKTVMAQYSSKEGGYLFDGIEASLVKPIKYMKVGAPQME